MRCEVMLEDVIINLVSLRSEMPTLPYDIVCQVYQRAIYELKGSYRIYRENPSLTVENPYLEVKS